MKNNDAIVGVLLMVCVVGLAGCMSGEQKTVSHTQDSEAPVQVADSAPQQRAPQVPQQKELKQAPAPRIPAPPAAQQNQSHIQQYFGESSQSLDPVEEAIVTMRFWAFSLAPFRLRTGRYPTTEEGLQYLVEESTRGAGIGGEPIPEHLLNDPWGNPYIYTYTGDEKQPFSIRSLGPDGEESDNDLFCEEVAVTHAAVVQLEQQQQ